MTAELGDGRFGPSYIGIDPDSGQIVVIRTFADAMTPGQQQALIDGLDRLCQGPLSHPSIAAPIACGDEGGVAYFVHTCFAGELVDEYFESTVPGPCPR